MWIKTDFGSYINLDYVNTLRVFKDFNPVKNVYVVKLEAYVADGSFRLITVSAFNNEEQANAYALNLQQYLDYELEVITFKGGVTSHEKPYTVLEGES
jgi:hypothetical protein